MDNNMSKKTGDYFEKSENMSFSAPNNGSRTIAMDGAVKSKPILPINTEPKPSPQK